MSHLMISILFEYRSPAIVFIASHLGAFCERKLLEDPRQLLNQMVSYIVNFKRSVLANIHEVHCLRSRLHACDLSI